MMTDRHLLWLMLRTCAQKNKYTYDNVETRVDRMAAEGKISYYYECPFCNHFHLTSKEPNKQLGNDIKEALKVLFRDSL